MAEIWTGAIGVPTVPVVPGEATSGAVTLGKVVAVMVNATVKLLLAPSRLLAVKVVLTLHREHMGGAKWDYAVVKPILPTIDLRTSP